MQHWTNSSYRNQTCTAFNKFTVDTKTESFHLQIWKIQILKILHFGDVKFTFHGIFSLAPPILCLWLESSSDVSWIKVHTLPFAGKKFEVRGYYCIKCKILHRQNVKFSESEFFRFVNETTQSLESTIKSDWLYFQFTNAKCFLIHRLVNWKIITIWGGKINC